MGKKKITWMDLKKAIDKMPKELLKNEVCIWGEESGTKILCLEKLKEDYVFDGDEGCAPLSDIKNSYNTKEEWEEWEDEHRVIHPKGTVIICVEEYLKVVK